MAKRQKQKSSAKQAGRRRQNNGRPWLWPLLLLVVLFGVGLVFFLNRSTQPPGGDLQASPTATAVADPESTPGTQVLPPGRANYCQAPPSFPLQLPLDRPTYVGTSLRGFVGLTLSDAGGQVYQDETWDDAGQLGPFVYDWAGNIYTAPTPFIDLSRNAPSEQNKIYKVDSATGAMAEWVDLPAAQQPTQSNPFGVLGLFYDCDTDSIYAGSIAGSTATDEVGRLVQVDQESAEVVDYFANVDAMGVGVYNGADGKRLYFGSGRDSGVRSIALDEAGHFVGEPRVEFFLAQFEEGGNEKAQRITFTPNGQMVVKGIEFNYTLRAASDAARVEYVLDYDPESAAWTLNSVERITE